MPFWLFSTSKAPSPTLTLKPTYPLSRAYVENDFEICTKLIREKQYAKAIKHLTDKKLSPNIQNGVGDTLLIHALKFSAFPMITHLLQQKNIDLFLQNNNGWTCLHWAVFCEVSNLTLDALIRQGGSKLANITSSQGIPPFHFAILNDNLDFVKRLNAVTDPSFKIPTILSLQFPKMSEKIKLYLGAWPRIRVLLIAHYKEPESVFFRDFLPRDLLKLILSWSALFFP